MLSSGYFSIPRSLIIDPLWISLPLTYRYIYMIILANACYKPTTQDDFGVLVHLQKGQFLTTERELVKLCETEGIDKSLVHRALEKFQIIGFSNQTSNHRKTIITITRKDIIEMTEPNFEPNSNQTRTIKEEDNNIKKEKEKESSSKESCQSALAAAHAAALAFPFSSEDVYLKNLNGKTISLTSGEIYKHFLGKYPTDIVSKAIQHIKSTNPTTSDILKLLDVICLRFLKPIKEKTVKSRKILEFETLPKCTEKASFFKIK